MKSRSHRPQSHDVAAVAAADDWGDGSWTVDCVCGVNFDDGEEMVNCDECGVWVHTRCSRYVKGEELFTCDKCKGKNSRYNNHNSNVNDSEETEVAQLLVELPTKTIRLESSYNNAAAAGSCPPPRGGRPFRLWTDRPMEDRVHVQGIPGGDPALFRGLSSIFMPELWKCTGYVPKKFNFRYREFPCWDDDEEKKDEVKNEEENENNIVDKGAGVLFSLSKDSVALVDQRVYSKDVKKWEDEGRDGRRSQIGVKKERRLLQPFVIHTGKRKKEDLGLFKDQSGKKKARNSEKEIYVKKRVSHISKTAFTSTSDAKPLEFYEDRHMRNFKNDIQSTKNKCMRDPVTQEQEADGNVIGNGVERHKNDTATVGPFALASSTGAEKNEEKASLGIPATVVNSTKVETGLTTECNAVTIHGKKEGNGMDDGNPVDNAEEFTGIDVKPSIDTVAGAAQVAKNNLTADDGDSSLSSSLPRVERDNNDSGGGLNCQSSLCEGKAAGKTNDNVSEKSNKTDTKIGSSPYSEHKPQEVVRTLEAISNCHAGKADISTGDLKQNLEGSELVAATQKCPELKHGLVLTKDLSKSGETILDSPALATQHKDILSIGKSSSAPSTVIITESSVPEIRSADALNANTDTKQRAMSESTSSIKKDRAGSDSVKDAERNEFSRKMLKERPKSCVNSVLQSSNSSRISHTYGCKRTSSDTKDLPNYLSSKQSLAETSPENTGSQQHDASHAQDKAPTSGLPMRGEKFNQSSGQPSSKSSINPHLPTSSPAGLSDEELALLLHQELNSSPRVPRVPRVRQAGSLPQLISPTATSMLIKRTSSSGGKDCYGSVSRRKSKDSSKDGFRRSHNLDNEPKRPEKRTSSPDQRRRDTGFNADGMSKREDNGSPAAVNLIKKNVPLPPTSTSTANSGPSSSTEVNDHHLSSVRNSPRNISDEEAGTVTVPVHRTLPGLINEIMSKGRRMTYEELCNAVLPHWHNLRKHNGERYAYSSHSQAVLDCLRNRQEWAQLVDRGPKTNSSKKKRRLDIEDSEDNDYGKGRATESKSLESREEFPKGKRNTRKRRRLALQGREIKDIRNGRKAGLLSDDDSGRFSPSSEEILFSDDEIQGNGAGPVGNEGSASSDEMGTM